MNSTDIKGAVPGTVGQDRKQKTGNEFGREGES